MMRIFAFLLVLLCTACASPQFVAQVSSRSTLTASAPLAGKRFVIERKAGQEQSLARQDYEAQVSAALKQRGMVQVGDSRFADWLVQFDYRLTGPLKSTTSTPFWGTVGIGTGGWHGVGIGMTIPIFQEMIATTYFGRELNLDIYDPRALQSGQFAKLYESRALNASPENVLEPAVPWLIRAVFQEFPVAGNSRREVRLPLTPPAGSQP
ncbi:DUF4136 domain-containing protein [Chitinilyticum litopenaei]|uniref:DUF4136 domain-containing protein n=1 Tax=Chitinilyticum litopenaei TaxID=1121276 RepID=UPI00048AFFBA|nr:DUF4136 domain-containing protein [Chitinilyticum litopenaei]